VSALIFDLDGTLVDTVYFHTLAWQRALGKVAIDIDAALLHRLIGIDGGLLMTESARMAGRELSRQQMDDTSARHAEIFAQLCPRPRPTTGATELLSVLKRAHVPHGIATSGEKKGAVPALRALKLGRSAVVVDGSEARAAKPAPDLFLRCRRRLKVGLKTVFVIGDAVWDVLAARRAGMLAVGLSCGGFGEDELYQAGAFRVYRNPAALLDSLAHLGIHV
jgi:beta-phosphoglucomutase-like phosphatase (HAD superfamily)